MNEFDYDSNDTFLIDGVDTLPHLLLAVCVHIHIWEDPGLVGPHIVVGAKEVNGELSDIMPHPLDVLWDGFRVADLRWPPPGWTGEGRKHLKLRETSQPMKDFREVS